MTGFLIENQYCLFRIATLQLAIRKAPIFESYKIICKIMEDKRIDYVEFEYWYMRFYNGEKDLDYGNRITRPHSLSISKLPVEIITMVLGWLDAFSSLNARCVSKRLRSIIENEKPTIEDIMIFETIEGIEIHFDKKRIVLFSPSDSGCTVRDEKLKKVTVPGRYYVGASMNYLKPLFMNPKLRLESLTLGCEHNSESFRCIIHFLSNITDTLNSQFYTKKLNVILNQPVSLNTVLPLVKPGFLEIIYIESTPTFKFGIQICYKTPHFKQAKSILHCNFEALHPAIIDKLGDWEHFEILLQYVSIEDLVKLRNKLSNSTAFQFCRISLKWNLGIDDLERVFGDVTFDDSYGSYRHQIANSSFFLHFRFHTHDIFVEKKQD